MNFLDISRQVIRDGRTPGFFLHTPSLKPGGGQFLNRITKIILFFELCKI